jgi:hypothetical protein
MHFFRDCGRGLVAPTFGSSVLVRQPGRILMYYRTLRFSALASCVALPSERRTVGAPTVTSMQSSARCFRDAGPLALIAMDGMYGCFAGAKKQITKKSLFLEALLSRYIITNPGKSLILTND